MSEPFKIKYDRNRFPIRQRREDGTLGCRGCGAAIPKGRKTWCSKACVDRYDPFRVLVAVRKRDGDVCQLCGLDCRKAKAHWLRQKPSHYTRDTTWDEWRWKKPPAAEYDHILPFSEGGLTVLENMRTLCAHCHRAVTAAWRKKRVKAEISSQPNEGGL